MNHRIFERTLHSLVFRRVRLFEYREILKLDSFIVCLSLDLDFAVSLWISERLVLKVLADPCFVGLVLTQRDKFYDR